MEQSQIDQEELPLNWGAQQYERSRHFKRGARVEIPEQHPGGAGRYRGVRSGVLPGIDPDDYTDFLDRVLYWGDLFAYMRAGMMTPGMEFVKLGEGGRYRVVGAYGTVQRLRLIAPPQGVFYEIGGKDGSKNRSREA